MKQIQFSDGRSCEVSKIIGVGKNYAAHAEEMNTKPPAEPVLFLKPPTALYDIQSPIPIPRDFGSVHYELELAVCIGAQARQVSPEKAMNFVSGYGMALDLTLRDKQNLAKNAGLPWALAKGFDHSCPVSVFVPAEYVPDINDLKITFSLNDQVKQQASTAQMLFSVEKLISYISLYFTLNPGDLILTGTPAGVGPLSPGDQFEASITRIGSVKSQII